MDKAHKPARINIDIEALRRAFPAPEPGPMTRLVERMQAGSEVAAPFFTFALNSIIGRLRR